MNRIKVNKYDYCMIRLPGIRNFLSCITFMVAPCEITCVTFKMHSSPAGGSMNMLEQDGSGEGGTWLLLQFPGSLQLPEPVNVYMLLSLMARVSWLELFVFIGVIVNSIFGRTEPETPVALVQAKAPELPSAW